MKIVWQLYVTVADIEVKLLGYLQCAMLKIIFFGNFVQEETFLIVNFNSGNHCSSDRLWIRDICKTINIIWYLLISLLSERILI